MSRIGRMPIDIAKGVKVDVTNGLARVQGPKGTLEVPIAAGISCRQDGERLIVERADDSKQKRALHGLMRSLLANAVHGAATEFKKELEIQGIGYRAQAEGKDLVFSLGFSHPVHFPVPEGISVSIEKQTKLTVSGADKQMVGQVAADIRSLRKPDVYKGKGIRYVGEIVHKKVGKTGAK